MSIVSEVEIISAGNLVRMHFRGQLNGEKLQARLGALEDLLNRMQPGFTLLTDLSELDSMDLDCGPYIAKAMELVRARGVGKVVRIIPDPHKDIGFNIFSIIHYRGKIPIATFSTLAEAEKELK